jgi:L-lactate dehydrogenase (cytochrome)/glycolate oxidase
LGAKAVLIGRPYLYGLAAAGEPGVYEILQIFKREIDAIMGAIGCKSVRDLDPSYVVTPEVWPRWNPGS